MVRPKQSSSKKAKQKGVDFKKIKRKIGRKLPPPKNATNTEVKSKAIVLPEQSIASDRAGFAVNKKGITLKELLHQTSHHNAKSRRGALAGIKDLVLKHPSELTLHKLAIIEKLRERICDNDKIVRETLYQILKTVIFPHSKEDMSGPIISLMMAYIFNAMTHIAVDIRLMAFKFFELVVSSCPSSFFLYAEKVLDNYVDILRNNQIYLKDKNKLKNALGGLVRCLSLFVSKKVEDDPLKAQNMVERRCLHAFETESPKDHEGLYSIIKKFEDLVPVLVNCFHEFASSARALPMLETHLFDCMLCTLDCINLAVKISASETNRPQLFLSSTPINYDVTRRMMVALLKKLWEAFPLGQQHGSTTMEDEKYFILDIRIAEIFLQLSDRISDNSFLFEKFLKFIEHVLLGQVGSNFLSNKMFQKHLASIIPFIPGIVSQTSPNWRTCLLKAFTVAFENCKVDSKMSLLYLAAIEEMLLHMKIQDVLPSCFDYYENDEILDYQITWLQELPMILLQLDDKHSSVSKVVLRLLLRIGQSSLPNSPIALSYDQLQWKFKEFFSYTEEEHHGTFIKLPIDCQELAICCLYYFSSMSTDMLKSLASCCLCDDLEPKILLRIVEVVDSAYKAGHVQIADHIGFLVTLVARFTVFPEKFCIGSDGKLSNRQVFKSLIGVVSSCIYQMGDNSLVQRLLLKKVSNDLPMKVPLDNLQGLLKMIIMLNVRPVKVPKDDIDNLSRLLSGYLIDSSSYLSETVDSVAHPDQTQIFRYYVRPCLFLFYGNEELLFNVLKLLDSLVMVDECSLDPLSRVHAVTSVLIFMLKDARLVRSLSSRTIVIDDILQGLHKLKDSSKFNMPFEEAHKLQSSLDQLEAGASKLKSQEASNMAEV